MRSLPAILILLFATSSFAADNALICFPYSDAQRLDQERQTCKDVDTSCTEYEQDADAQNDACENTGEVLKARIEELEGEKAELIDAGNAAREGSEVALKEAGGSWWTRLRSKATTATGAAGGAALGATFGGPGGAAVGAAIGALLGAIF